MKKYSLYLITIPLTIIVVVLFLRLSAESKNKLVSEKQEITKNVVTEKQDVIYNTKVEDTTTYRFEDFPAIESFNGTPALPNFKTNPEARMFETVTVAGAKDGPNFAGAFTVVEYGCGTNCQLHTILNAKTGAVVSYDELLSFYDVEYRLDSRLLVVNPKKALVENFGDDIPQYFKTKYYELTKDGLKLRELGVKENPSFDDVIAKGCCIENCSAQKYNPYLGKKVQWKAMVSDYAHTDGIRFIVIDENHTIESYKNRGLFYGTFLASGYDPRLEEEGSEKWSSKWHLSWVEYIMDVYGNIRNEDRDENTVFSVTATIEDIDCDKNYDGGYIETAIEKIEITK